jgi:hypothetical protein
MSIYRAQRPASPVTARRKRLAYAFRRRAPPPLLPWPSPLSHVCSPVAAASSGVVPRLPRGPVRPAGPRWSKSGATSHWCRSSAWRAAARCQGSIAWPRPRPGGGPPRAGRGAGRPAKADGRRAPGRAGRAPRRPAPGRRPAPDPGLFFPVPAAAVRRASLSTPGGPPRVGRRREARPCAVGREGEIHGGCRWLAPRRSPGASMLGARSQSPGRFLSEAGGWVRNSPMHRRAAGGGRPRWWRGANSTGTRPRRQSTARNPHHPLARLTMSRAVSRLMSGQHEMKISVPWTVPITWRQRAWTPFCIRSR